MDEELGVVEQRKQKYRQQHDGKELLELVKEMQALGLRKEALEAQLSEVNAEYDVLRIELIPTAMEEAGIERVVYEGIGRVTLTGDMYVRTKGDKQSFYEWLGDNGFGALVQETVNSSTLKAWAKGQMKKGEPIPEEFVSVTPFTRASITKA